MKKDDRSFFHFAVPSMLPGAAQANNNTVLRFTACFAAGQSKLNLSTLIIHYYIFFCAPCQSF